MGVDSVAACGMVSLVNKTDMCDDPFEPNEADKKRLAEELAKYDSPEEVSKREKRRIEDFERGVRLGWWDKDGESIPQDDTEDDDEDDDAVT